MVRYHSKMAKSPLKTSASDSEIDKLLTFKENGDYCNAYNCISRAYTIRFVLYICKSCPIVGELVSSLLEGKQKHLYTEYTSIRTHIHTNIYEIVPFSRYFVLSSCTFPLVWFFLNPYQWNLLNHTNSISKRLEFKKFVANFYQDINITWWE